MTKQLERIVNRLLSDAESEIRRAACGVGGDTGRILSNLMEETECRFMRGRRGTGIRPETLTRREAELREAFAVLEKEVGDRFARFRRRRTVALIEYPLLAATIGDGLRKQGIPFLLETRLDRNVLTVRVVSEYFLEIPVTLERPDRRAGPVLHTPAGPGPRGDSRNPPDPEPYPGQDLERQGIRRPGAGRPGPSRLKRPGSYDRSFQTIMRYLF